MNSNGDICPYCGDILPEDGSPCPACRHLHERGLPNGADLDMVEQERDLSNDDGCMAKCDRIDTKASKSLDVGVRNNPGNVLTEIPRNLKASSDTSGVSGPDALASTRSPQQRRRKRRRHYVKALLMQQPTLDRNEPTSTCIVCGTLHFRAALSVCPRCGGICKVMTLDEIDWMARLNPNLAYLPRL